MKPTLTYSFTQTPAEFCAAFYEALAPTKTLFRDTTGGLIAAPGVSRPSPVLGVEHFRGILPDLADFQRLREDRYGVAEIPIRLPREAVIELFHSEAKSFLPLIRAIVAEPAIQLSPAGQPTLTVEGFNPGSGVYYHRDPSQPHLLPREGTEHLERCFAGVPFAGPAYRHNVYAYLFGALTLSEYVDAPLLAIVGNMRGIGKSSLSQAIGAILTGSIPSPISARADEIEKQVSACFMEGSRFILIDNVVSYHGKGFRSDRLASLLTSGKSKNVRILGTSRRVAQTGTLFALTQNEGKLDPDLTTRALLVKLHAPVARPMVPYCRDYAMEHRAEIYGELLGLHLAQPAALSTPDHPAFRFRRWLALVKTPMEARFGPLAIEEARELDETLIEVFGYGQDFPGLEEGADTILSRVMASDRYPCLREKFEQIPSQRGRRVSLGRVLTGLCEHAPTFQNVTISMKGKPSLYTFTVQEEA